MRSPFFIFFSSFSTSSAAAPRRVKMIPAWELTPTAVTRILPLPSITWVPERTIGSAVTPFLTWNQKYMTLCRWQICIHEPNFASVMNGFFMSRSQVGYERLSLSSMFTKEAFQRSVSLLLYFLYIQNRVKGQTLQWWGHNGLFSLLIFLDILPGQTRQ